PRVLHRAEVVLDLCIVAVAAVHSLGGIELVLALQLDAGDVLNEIHQAVDRHQLAGAEVDRLLDPAVHDPIDATDAVIDVHEAARLVALAPDLNLVVATKLCLDDLAANGSGRLLPAAVPSAVRAVDVVETAAARGQPE